MSENVQPEPFDGQPPKPAGKSRGCLLPAAIIFAVLVIGLLVGAQMIGRLWRLPAEPKKATDTFFLLTASKGADAAWATADPAFQRTTTASTWEFFVRLNGLSHYTSSVWPNWTIDPNGAQLRGTVNLSDGRSVPMTVGLVKDDGTWRVLSIDMKSDFWPSRAIGLPGTNVGLPSQGPPPDVSSLPPPVTTDTSPISAQTVAGICTDTLAKRGMTLDNMSCYQGLSTTPRSATYCTGKRAGTTIAVTAVLDRYDAKTARPTLACVLDDR